AYAALATGLIPLGPLIEAGPVVQPPSPADTVIPETLLTVPLGGLALAGVAGADAHAHQADDIPSILGSVEAIPNVSDPTTLTGVNAQGLAKTTGAALVFNDPGGDPNTVAIRGLLAQISDLAGGLLGADAVTAEAVAKCVNNQPVYETGYQVLGLGGLVGGILDPLVTPLLELLLPLLGPDAALSAIISIETGVVTPLNNGIAIDALVIRVPILNQVIAVSHAEAYVPPGCSVAPPATIPPTGPGPVAPTARLAVTGGDLPFVPMALVLLGSALVLRRIVRKRPEASSIG
ncbi:MAG: hypothetical protein LC733_02305, partial [Actinobacteria bacterium]|nr:hypothetical protein [Actinomycetota bacterium]